MLLKEKGLKMRTKITNLERLDVRIKSLQVRIDVLRLNPPPCYENKLLRLNLNNDIKTAEAMLLIAKTAWNNELELMKY